jgi:starch synthase
MEFGMGALVSHPTGNANMRAVLRGLQRVGALEEFCTTVGLPPCIDRASLLSEKIRRRLSQRSFPEAPWKATRLRPWREVTRLAARGARLTALTQHETGWASVDAVYRDLDKAVAKRLRSSDCSASIVYAYEDGAFETFHAGKDTGKTCVYDLPTAHWRTIRQLLEEEANRLPEWAGTMQGLRDSAEKLDLKDAEIELADHIVVASQFTRNSLLSAFEDVAVHVTPYGCPPLSSSLPTRRSLDAPIELLFVGRLSQPKGIADLIVALDLLEIDWRLTLSGQLPAAAPKTLHTFLADPRVNWLGSVPHATILERMALAHVFVFPSILEGFGMVITEALSAGLPVVTTPNTAGPEILTEGKDGFIVPIRSPEALADCITSLADNEDLRLSMAWSARDTASRMNWSRYEAQIADLVTLWDRGE